MAFRLFSAARFMARTGEVLGGATASCYTLRGCYDGMLSGWIDPDVFGPAERDARLVGAVAQLGERLVRNEEVSGSIPLSSTKTMPALFRPLP